MPPHPTLRRGAALAVAGAAGVLAACRADSITTPDGQAACVINCRASQGTAADSAVYTAMSDAASRLVPGLAEAAARARLATLLTRLERAMAAGAYGDARRHLALTYAAIDELDAAHPEYAPDHDAVRLALVPTATTLGVRTP